MTDSPYPDPTTRRFLTVSIMAATILVALDQTIANVALPHIQGSVSASSDEATWVLTSYIVASAIMTPLSGWLADRFGRKRLLVASIVLFTIASGLCGIATNLTELVLFRMLQGIGGAALIPMSQAILFDINPPEKHAQAMSIWGMGSVLGPITGPVLGGWLTENLSWRWCFYINLPIGILACLGILTFLDDRKTERRSRLDLTGFAMLAVAIGAFQLMLDRGQQQDWFSSTEICIEALVAAFALYCFIVHMLTVEAPFISKALFKDVNFATSSVVAFFVGIAIFALVAIMPPMIETLLGYPVMTTGLVMAPRGLGTLLAMALVGRLMRIVDPRIVLFCGLGLNALSLHLMSHFSLAMDSRLLITTGFLNGVATGLAYVPMSTMAFATLPPRMRNEASAVFALVRNIGMAAGISALQVLAYRNAATVHSRLSEAIRPDNPVLALRAGDVDFTMPAAVAQLEAQIGRQAAMVSYIDSFWLLGTAVLVIMPFLFLLRRPGARPGDEPLPPAHMD